MKNTKKAKILSIVGKTSDLCVSTLKTASGHVLKENDGYVPSLMPGEHYGDYIEIDIDIETGVILNWKKPTQDQIKYFIETGK